MKSSPVHISVPLKEVMKEIEKSMCFTEDNFMAKTKQQFEKSPYISPNELAIRWQCSRSSVDRISRRAGLRRLCIGKGKNGSVRYLRKEVIAYEKRLITTK